MTKNLLIFVPDSLERHRIGYFKGCHKKFDNCEAYYITSDSVSNNTSQCIGYVGKHLKKVRGDKNASLFISTHSEKIVVNNESHKKQSIVQIIYDYKGFKNSDIVYAESESYGVHFKVLTSELRKNEYDKNENGRTNIINYLALSIIILLELLLKIIHFFKPILLYSATFLHFEEQIVTLKWFLTTVIEGKSTLKVGNAFTAKFADIIIGIILLNWFQKHENEILNTVEITTEGIIANLKGLLLYLMGSPIGLKLNYSFNKSLGTFFFYHISLWKVFLKGMQPLLLLYFRFLVLPGALGFSFQTAMFSDLISLLTFHVYCIYVYAARLFSLQIKGLVSLWRLFIGRKYNPLRQRVDSFQYSPNQLLIGTLGFTILLFLLPTTMMYYTVFTTFRVVLILIDGILMRFKYILNTVPLYVIALWIINSSSMAGTFYSTWKNCDDETVIIELKLKALPLINSVKKFIPDTIQTVKGVSFRYIFNCTVTGTLI